MAPTLISNSVTNSDRGRELSKRKKKKKKMQSARDQDQNPNGGNSLTHWNSESQQQVYSSKLLNALLQVRQSSYPSALPRGLAVREAADHVLAVTAKGRTRWSRAILTNRLKLKFIKNKRHRVVITGSNRLKKRRVRILRLKTKNLPAVQKKAGVLGRLIPGCRKEPLPVILEEATDYIAALEMQIRAMSTLAKLLSGSSGSPLSQPCSNRPTSS